MAAEAVPNEKQMDFSQIAQFKEDSCNLGRYTADFITSFYPSYSVNNELAVKSDQEEQSLDLLNSFTFYRICECSVYNIEDRFAYFADKMQKLFTMAYAIKQEVCYGIVSDGISTSLLLGVQPKSDDNTIKVIIEGLLPGIKIQPYQKKFKNSIDSDGHDKDRYVGCISGVPALKIDGEYQHKDLSSLMRSLNGHSYTMMVLCKPIDELEIQEKINTAIEIQDKCFAISKRTLSFQNGSSNGSTHADSYNEANGENVNRSRGMNTSGALPLAAVGAGIGSIIPGVGTVVGAVGGGLIGLLVGKQIGFNSSTSKGTSHTITKGYSDAVTETISHGESISGDIQNGFALELMKMADTMIDRLKIGRSIGMWNSVATFSSDSEMAYNIIKGSIYSQIASGLPDVLPPVVFSYKDSCHSMNQPPSKIHTQQLMIPKGFFDGKCSSPLMSLVTSEELCGICTIPVDPTMGFEIKQEKAYSLNYNLTTSDRPIGEVCEYDRPLPNVHFGFSNDDLNKHTFVCGLTGSGKTNTVKSILVEANVPFMVIEPAKQEYRNTDIDVSVYTLGRPEINCLKMNPFYILPGISPQQHIDMLKDLFSASFAFYGPMPYIVEKCLYRIYAKKGWNLTLGFHPLLNNSKNQEELFSQGKIEQRYGITSHRFLFPTMQDLKNEVDNYIENEMTYEGEVKGNIRSAIKARIDSLCVGAKGYMLNTHEFGDFGKLMESNVVLELEGLADDADKAFALGLLIIFVNEYRQVRKAVDSEPGLKHLLVIEEAHRLLKNVSTENNEDLGNPKGKAVEHFTNMLAEMRSYGQGVIVAEQIPSKLAPDVIKNSSNKIVHRIVAKDDQEIMSTTIGVHPADAIYLGNLKTGYALCHKEGMNQPITAHINKASSRKIRDELLYSANLSDKMFAINKSIIENNLSKEVSVSSVKTLVSLMIGIKPEALFQSLETAIERIVHKATIQAVTFVPGVDKRACLLNCMAEEIVSLMISGVFSINELPSNDFVDLIHKVLDVPTEDRICQVFNEMEKYYRKNPRKRAIEVVAGLMANEFANGQDVSESAEDFCFDMRGSFAHDVNEFLRMRVG